MNSNVITVAFLVPTADSRGPLNQIEILAEALAAHGVRSMLVTMRGGAGTVCTLPTVCLHMKHVWDARGLLRLRRVVRDNQITILHSRLNSANFWGALFRSVFGSPCHVMNVTNSITTSFRYTHGPFLGILHRFAYQHAINGADAIVANALYLKEEIETSCKPRARVSVVDNAMRPRAFEQRARQASRVIGVVSRIEYYKHVDDLIRAFPTIAEGMDDVVLHVIGAGAYLGVCKEIAQGFPPEIRSRIAFWGHRDDIQSLLPHFSVLVHTSESEGQPNAVLEAMNAGVPVVCSRYPGVETLIQHNVNGLIYGAGGHDDLARTVVRVLSDEDLRSRLSMNAWRHIQDCHSPERAGTAFMGIYRDVLSQRNADHG